jgi:hypothetical protein
MKALRPSAGASIAWAPRCHDLQGRIRDRTAAARAGVQFNDNADAPPWRVCTTVFPTCLDT